MVHIQTPVADGKDVAPSGGGTKVTLPSGEELKGVSEIDVHITPDDVIKARMSLFCTFNGVADPYLFVTHPVTGEVREVRQIEFIDGEVWSADTAWGIVS